MKTKKNIVIAVLVILSIVLYAVFAKPALETHTWVLSFAQQIEPYFVVAHRAGDDFSGESSYDAFSKEVELTCVAKDGKLTLTDKTNGKVYFGTYEVTSWNRFSGQRYVVVIDGIEGTANISSGFNRTLFISLGNYYLNFEVQ